MCTLKNYKKYRKSIDLYTKAINLKVRFVEDLQGEGHYTPSKQQVCVDDNLSDAKEIATLLHELGHELDDSTDNLGFTKALNGAYVRTYAKQDRKSDKKIVLRCEKRAWNYGRILARKLKIKLGSWYDKEEKESLLAYKK